MNNAQRIDQLSSRLEEKVIAWRRSIHENPELGNREKRTSALVATHLEELGIETRRNIAHTGVVGVLRGGSPGRTIALRADMDALPVAEMVDLPFASKVRTTYNGQEVGVMHACGHDAHVAILMGVAELLSGVREQLQGTVLFVFQPAEEGAPEGEEGGAALMLKEGAFDDPAPEAIFGLHVTSRFAVGEICYKTDGMMASSDEIRIVVRGRQTHGAYPWLGVDPIVTASQIVLALQTIVSRQVDLTIAPAVVTIGSIHGGVRNNIIPDEVSMLGTIRALDDEVRNELLRRVRLTVESVAAASGAEASVEILRGYPITWNDPQLAARMHPTLEAAAGAGKVTIVPPVLGAEDFSFYQKMIPGLFFWVGTRPADQTPEEAPSNHSPHFYVDESGLILGLRAMTMLTFDYLNAKP
jgi:amidohydrolase